MIEPEDHDSLGDLSPEPVEQDDTGEYTCPVCGDYTGKRSSVEAHITGKSDDDHRGKVGKDYRAPGPDGEPILVDSPFAEADPDQISTANESEDSSENESNDEPDLSRAIDAGDGSFPGVAAVALIIVAWWIARQSGNEDAVTEVWDEL